MRGPFALAGTSFGRLSIPKRACPGAIPRSGSSAGCRSSNCRINLSCDSLPGQAVQRGIVASISAATVWRWLSADAIRPWSHRTWIFPRDKQFRTKAERVLDLYHRVWAGHALLDDEYVVCADEKTSIQARKRCHATQAPRPGRRRRVEFEYERHGALTYMAAWGVHRARIFGQCEKTTGTDALHRLVDHVMRQEPYRSARRVFWITDNGSSHRGEPSVARLAQWYPHAVQVHTPVHASWLNQVEIHFSIVQRKLLTPPDFPDLETLESRLLEFQSLYEKRAKPFEWKFSRDDLNRLLNDLGNQQPQQQEATA
ncbi:MAG: IS630 family transposase [Candidatus Hydrogenedentes bacterium]|nr:IS630 family transposase [Candidatus Hydrogenedentota bacterium]